MKSKLILKGDKNMGNLFEMVKRNKKKIIKRSLIVAGTLVGLVMVATAVKATGGGLGDLSETESDQTEEEAREESTEE